MRVFNRPTLIAAALAVLIGGVGITQANQPTPPARHVAVHQQHVYKPKPAPAPPAPAAPPAPTPTTAAPKAAAPRTSPAVAGRGCVAPSGFEAGVNQVRAAHGLPALCTNAALRQAARNRANYMCSNNVFSHDGFYGQVAAVYSAPTGLIGENISAGLYPGGDDQVVQEFVNSPHHFENIVRADYTEQGAASIMCPPPYCTAIGICGAPVPVQINVNNFGG